MSISRVVVAALLFASAISADAATLVVTNANTSGAGSLSKAIADANLTVAPDIINFNIPAAPVVKTIGGLLPEITQPLTIDGYTQSGASKNTRIDDATNAVLRIEIDASSVPLGGAAIKITGGPVTLRGLAIKNIPFKTIGIDMGGDETSSVRGCFVGTDVTGNVDLSQGVGIVVRTTASIGGASVGDRNLVSGHDGAGIQLKGFGFGLLNNLIGTNANGDPVLGNGTGVLISVSTVISSIGGSSTATANVIAGNEGPGIRILPAALGNTSIAVNSIHDNGGLGIDLGTDSVTDNDAFDEDDGPNGLQNFPVITFARANAAKVTVEGYLESKPGSYRISFYRNAESHPSGFGEGETFIDSIEVTIPDGEEKPIVFFSAALTAGLGLNSTLVLTATAESIETAATSEFSEAFEMLRGGQTLVVSNTNDSGVGSLRQAILESNAAPDINTIVFDLPNTGPQVIAPLTALLLEAPVIVDGYSQPGSSFNTLEEGSNADLRIVIDGSNMPVATKIAVAVRAPDTVVRGIVVHSAPGVGIGLVGGTDEASEGIRIEGCFIGTDASGTQDLGNGSAGIALTPGAVGAVIGGPSVTQRNVISGNGGNGIRSGGGVVPRILNNIIGGTANGSAGLGNGDSGIVVSSGGSVIGSDDPVAGNVIRSNAGAGIEVTIANGHEIRGNRIFDNDGIGVDIVSENLVTGVTDNDIDDVDDGPNGSQNFPEIFDTSSLPGSFKIDGQLDVPAAAVGANYTLRFYVSKNCDPSGHGEGDFFAGAAEVVLSDSAQEFLVDLPISVKEGAVVTATATEDATGNTSEFSECFGGAVVAIVCGDANVDTKLTSPDALLALKAAVGTAECELCRCDVNDKDGISSVDALLVLRSAVGQEVNLSCPACL